MGSPLPQYRRIVNRLLADYRLADTTVRGEGFEFEQLSGKIGSVQQAQVILQTIAQRLQQQAHERIARVVTRCLVSVFEDPYEFQIRWEQRRGQTEAVMVFVRDGVSLSDPLNEIGGGVIDVVAFALRLAAILLSRPARRRLLVLDEPFRFVSRRYRKRLRAVVEQLSKEMGFQFIVVTHLEDFEVGEVINLEEHDANQ